MDKPAKQISQSAKPVDDQRGIGVVELLFAAAALGAAVLVVASRGPKVPPGAGE